MSMSGRNVLRIAIAVAAVGWFGWSYFHPHDKSPASASAAPAATATVPARPMPPAKPKTWTVGSLTLKSCELGRPDSGTTTAAWCTTFKVPENRADPHGRSIGLKLALMRSDAAVADKDMVVLLSGGPGQAATDASQMAALAFAGALKHHDVLLLDQRGTGGSNALDCKAVEGKQGENLNSADPDALRAQLKACLDEVSRHADPRYYTTTIAVQDLEDVRQALGAPTFDLVGVSYGTRMAQQYLMRHPDAVRSVVLDSPAPNQMLIGQDFAANLDRALKLDFALCTADAACKKRFGDPMQTLHQLRDALHANPHQVSYRDPDSWAVVTRPLNAQLLVHLVQMFAYAPESAALLPLTIDAAAHGDVAPLMGQYKLMSGDLNPGINAGMFLSVVCSEDADQIVPRPEDDATVLGNHFVDALKTQCSVWPHGTRPADFHTPLKSDKPILILDGEFDPVTPPAYGKTILAGLGNGRQLIFKGQGHGELIRGCMPKLLTRFIDKPDPKGLDASCLDRLGPTPAFVNFNGATP
jgi:pimeloyl-ACP methyl ester carboxylesterase